MAPDDEEREKAADALHEKAARKRTNPFKSPPNYLTTKDMTPPASKGQAAPGPGPLEPDGR